MSKSEDIEASPRKSTNHKKITRRIIISLAVILTVLGGYEIGRHNHLWGEPDELRVIKSEKMASSDLLGLEVINTIENGAGSMVSKTVSPSVSRTFRVKEGEIDATKQKIIELAEEDGWKHDTKLNHTDTWRGKKRVGKFDLFIAIRKSYSFENAIEVEI